MESRSAQLPRKFRTYVSQGLMLLFFFFHGFLLDFAHSKFSQLSRIEGLGHRSKLAPFWETITDDGEFDKWISFSTDEASLYKKKARAMFYHGYDHYMAHAFPLDELDPIGCAGRVSEFASLVLTSKNPKTSTSMTCSAITR
ncbi:unnamed protein product [Oikopleura dioica]|uniref:Uncharacterized protein n=1 Tax=Oikopleura dioica TaxID=34765 RepID=E4X022_OIKDI|nr:unnamed protein product [Oikopleura dioica]